MKRELKPVEKIIYHEIERSLDVADSDLKTERKKAMAKMGRKPFPDHKRRKHQVTVRFNDAEYEVLSSILGDHELAELVRQLAMEAATQKSETTI